MFLKGKNVTIHCQNAELLIENTVKYIYSCSSKCISETI